MNNEISYELERILNHIRETTVAPLRSPNRTLSDEPDELLLDAAKYIIDSEKASIGNLQRIFRIGFNRAAMIMDQLAELGVVSAEEGTKARAILIGREELERLETTLLYCELQDKHIKKSSHENTLHPRTGFR